MSVCDLAVLALFLRVKGMIAYSMAFLVVGNHVREEVMTKTQYWLDS